ncbi:hypothetical protein [Pelagibacterium luteolum]|uniref:Holin n=1 Tax=Pelagibacterium luteolum TaxID=440168 RepID=A0A1G7TGI2_9HYPH|nr:hypothetical protein [Pelagibacterium luteolum]SDG34311.1 hypothetical protein SAMN04487974_102112 [Pelagibacterium luteolum]
MLTTIMTAISQNAALGWIVRRIFDWGGWLLSIIGGALALWSQLDPVTQATLLTVLQGNWGEVTLGSAFGFAALVISQWRSWRATVKPQVVDGQKHRRELTDAEALAMNNAATGHNQTHIQRR